MIAQLRWVFLLLQAFGYWVSSLFEFGDGHLSLSTPLAVYIPKDASDEGLSSPDFPQKLVCMQSTLALASLCTCCYV